MKAMTSVRNAERGSALIYIMVCVVLFAALSYVVANMTRSGGGNDLDREQITLAVSEILTFTNAARSGVQQMRIAGVPDTDISFDNPNLTGYTNANCGGRAECEMFNAGGGGVTYTAPHEDWLDLSQSGSDEYGNWYFPDLTCVEGAGGETGNCAGDGADNEDLVAILPWLKRSLCIAINDDLGVPNPGGEPPVDANGAWPAAASKFTGVYSDTGSVQIGMGGVRSACINTMGGYAYYAVILAR